MKINGSSDPLRIDRPSTPATGGTKSADKAGSTPDTVQLSGLAAQLARLADEGKYRPAIDRTFPLAEAAKAVAHVQDGHARGKVVITVP